MRNYNASRCRATLQGVSVHDGRLWELAGAVCLCAGGCSAMSGRHVQGMEHAEPPGYTITAVGQHHPWATTSRSGGTGHVAFLNVLSCTGYRLLDLSIHKRTHTFIDTGIK